MELIPANTTFRFLAHRKKFLILSGTLIAVSILLMVLKGPNYSIDFRGGIEIQYKSEKPIEIGEIRSVLAKQGEGTAIVQKIRGTTEHEYLIAFEPGEWSASEKAQKIGEMLGAAFPENKIELRKVDSVGPRVGEELKKSAILAVLYALLLILGYVWFRFDISFSPAAVAAIIHDVMITLGFLVVLEVDFGLDVVAAILTIVGYSLNDTIVIFDRVRENIAQFGKLTIEKTMDRAMNECLSRTILTSLTTFFAAVLLLVFGGPALYPFAITMTIGIILGTYSTIYIASPIAIFIDEQLAKMKNKTLKRQPV